MSDREQPETMVQGPAEQKSDQYREIYANFSRIGMSPWDISIIFGTLNDVVAGKRPSVTSEAAIRMSPNQFKAFAIGLPLIMAEWEARFGEINVPKQFLMSAEMMRAGLAAAAEHAQALQEAALAEDKPKEPPSKRRP